mmetsp:Transcript_42725/g.117949  ORF Transcript_42725/g.117949 Transcript_42725/m.117949 type:complete len:857 (+) Transcript_42725:124-2694(+)
MARRDTDANAPLMAGVDEVALSDKVEELLDKLQVEEKVALLSGSSMWECGGVRRLGLPTLRVTDGPHGARGACLHGQPDSLLSPCEVALGATFNVDVLREVGELLGEDCARKGCHVLLGPTLNLQRYPISGRHFECYSEDPYLSARLAVAWVKGLQRYVAACAKHFVGNDQETDRGTMNSVIDVATLREIYLAPFEAAVVEGEVESIMCGYNRLNGDYCTENAWLLEQVLRREWGFTGFVMSDWWGNRATTRSLQAGLNLEMPGVEPRFFGGYLSEAVQRGEVSPELLRNRCRPLVQAALRTSRAVGLPQESAARRRAVLGRAAAESLVLLRNEGGVLPLDVSHLRRVAVIGPNAASTVLQGGGSSRVRTRRCPSILTQVRAMLEPRGVQVEHAPGCVWEWLPGEMITVDIEGLLSMGGGEADGQPSGWCSWVSRSTTINDMFLGFSAMLSQKEWFRRSVMPLLHRCGLRLSTPEEAAARRSPEPTEARTNASGGTCWLVWLSIAAAATAAAYYFGGARITACVAAVSFGLFAKPTLSRCLRRHSEERMMWNAEQAASRADACILVLGTHGWWELEGVDQPHMRLLGRQDELVNRVAAAAGSRPVIAVLNVGSPKELPWLELVPGVIVAHFGGEEAANAVVDALVGVSCPAGRLPTTWPRRLEDVPAVAAARAAARGSVPSNEGLPSGSLEYCEGPFVGYRGYQPDAPWARNVPKPLFPFGYGLSYTSFSYGPLTLKVTSKCVVRGDVVAEDTAHGPRAAASVTVTNVGSRAGADVPQLYVQTSQRPRALCGFKKTASLAPGQEEVVTFELGPRELGERYDASRSAWCPPQRGDMLKFEVGTSSTDVRQEAELRLL